MSDRQVLKNLLDDFFHEVLDRLEERKVDLLRWIRIGKQVEEDCTIYGNSVWSRIEGEIQRIDPRKVKFQVIDPVERSTLNRLADMAEEEPYRELTDAEERAEEATWD